MFFQNIEVYYLPMGNRHGNIDQAFRKTSELLKSTDAVNIADFHIESRMTYRDESRVIHKECVAKWSDK